MRADAEVRGGLRASASRDRDQRGAVTAETMVVLPVLVAVALGLVWLHGLAAAQVRVVDGAREAARVAARGEPDSAARGAGRRVAPDGASVAVGRGEGLVTAVVSVDVDGPGGLFRFLPPVTVRSSAVAVEEPS
jgi:Flp pilus assembly protein TadG